MNSLVNDFIDDLSALVASTEGKDVPADRRVTQQYEVNYLKRTLNDFVTVKDGWFSYDDTFFKLELIVLKDKAQAVYGRNTQLGVFRAAKSVERLTDKYIRKVS